MDNLLEQTKRFMKWSLKRNVQNYLNSKYDWKVTKAISTGTSVSENDASFREQTLNEYYRRLAAIDAATSMEALSKIRISF